MRHWLEERGLRATYWLLWKLRQGDHTAGFHERVNDAQSAISEIVTMYYSKSDARLTADKG